MTTPIVVFICIIVIMFSICSFAKHMMSRYIKRFSYENIKDINNLLHLDDVVIVEFKTSSIFTPHITLEMKDYKTNEKVYFDIEFPVSDRLLYKDILTEISKSRDRHRKKMEKEESYKLNVQPAIDSMEKKHGNGD